MFSLFIMLYVFLLLPFLWWNKDVLYILPDTESRRLLLRGLAMRRKSVSAEWTTANAFRTVDSGRAAGVVAQTTSTSTKRPSFSRIWQLRLASEAYLSASDVVSRQLRVFISRNDGQQRYDRVRTATNASIASYSSSDGLVNSTLWSTSLLSFVE